MTVKEYLMQYRRSMNRIHALTAHIAELRALCAKVSPTYTPIGSGFTASDRLGAAVANLVDAENDAAAELASLRETLHAVQDTIAAVSDERYRNLLYRRYICGETFEQIAVAMNYSYVHVTHRLHPAALKAADDIICKH